MSHFTFLTSLANVCYMLSPVRLSSVCNIRAPYTQPVEVFGNFSTPFGTLAIR